MKDNKILELKMQILNKKVQFLDIIVDIMKTNKIIYSDNYGELTSIEEEAISWVEPFMQLLYRGSKHSVGSLCESGFVRIVVHNDMALKFTYYSGPETFVAIEKIDSLDGVKSPVSVDLLCERLTESEAVKNELTPIIEKYLKSGLTFEEITRMFVEIMRENRIKI